jgi:hypothetical protein
MSVAAGLAAMAPMTRRAIATLVLAFALLLCWILVVMPVQALLLSQQEWRADTARQIARDRGMAKSASAVRAVAAAVDASPLKSRLYDASNGMAVTDALQNDLRNSLTQSGVEPTTFKILPATVVNGLRAHRVEFSSVMTVEQLRTFFVVLAAQPRYVRIERLKLDAPLQQRSDENPRVTALMEVRAFALETAASKPAVRVASAN